MAEKNMAIALIISFIFTGLGIAYAGDFQKGIIFFAIAIVLNILGMWVHMIFSISPDILDLCIVCYIPRSQSC